MKGALFALPIMSDLKKRRPSQHRRKNDRVVATAVVVLGALAVACVGMMVLPIWAVVVDAWQYHPEMQQCRPFDGTKARQVSNQLGERR